MSSEIGVAYVTLMPSMENFNKALREGLSKSLKSASKQMYKVVAEEAKRASDVFRTTVVEAQKDFSELSKGTKNVIREMSKDARTELKDTIRTVQTTSKATQAELNGLAKGTTSMVREMSKNTRTELASTVKQAKAASKMARQYTTTASAITKSYASITANVEKAIARSAKATSKAIKAATDATAGTRAGGGGAASNLTKALIGDGAADQEAIDTVAEILGERFGSTFTGKAVQGAQGLISDFSAVLKAGGPKAVAALAGVIALKGLEEITKIGLKMADKVLESFAKVSVKLAEVIVNAVKTAYVKVAEVLVDIGKKTIESIAKVAKEGYSRVGEVMKNMGVASIKVASSALGIDFVKSMTEGFTSGRAMQAFASAASSLTQTIVTAVKDAYTQAARVLVDLGRRTVESIANVAQQAYSKVGDVMKRVGKTAIQNAASSLGINIAGGVTQGLTSAKVAVGNVIANMISTATNTVTSSLGNAIARMDIINLYPRTMQNMGVANEAAQRSIEALDESIQGLPTSLDSLVAFAQKIFPSFEGDIDGATQAAIAFNNALVAGGADMVKQSNAMEQWAQMMSVGKVDMQAWRSVVEAMPAQMNQLAQAMGKANPMDLYNSMYGSRSGTTPLSELNDALIKLNEEGMDGFVSFSEQAATAAGGVGVAITNVSNRINKALESIMNWIGAKNIAGAINDISSKFVPLAERFTDFLDSIKAKQYIAAALDSIGDAFESISAKAAPLRAALAPIVSNALPRMLQILNDTLDAIVENADTLVSSLSNFITDIADQLRGIQPVINAFIKLKFATWSAALETWRTVISAIAPQLPKILRAQQQIVESVSVLVRNLAHAVAPVVGNLAQTIARMIRTARPVVELVIWDLLPVFENMVGHIEAIWNTVADIATEGGFIYGLARSIDSIMGKVGDTARHVVATLMPYLPVIVDMADVIAGAVTRAVKNLVNLLAPYIPQIADLFADAAEMLEPAIEKTVNVLSPHIGPIMDLVSQVTKFISDNLPGVAGVLGNIIGFIDPIISDVILLADTWLPKIETYINGFLSGLSNLYENTVKPLIDTIGTSIGNIMGDTLDTIEKQAGPVFESLNSFMNGFGADGSQLQPIIDALVGFGASSFISALGMWQSVISTIAPMMPGILQIQQGITENVATLVSNLAGPVSETAYYLFELVGDMIAKARPFIENVVNALVPVVRMIAVRISEIWDAVIGVVSEGDWLTRASFTLEQIMSAVGYTVREVIKAVGPFIPDILDAMEVITDAISDVVVDLARNLAPVIAEILRIVASVANTVLPVISDVVQALAPVFLLIAYQIKTVIETLVSYLDEEAINSIAISLFDIFEAIGNVVITAVNALAPYLPMIMDTISTVITALAPVVIDMINTLAPFIPQILDLFTKAATELAPTIQEVFDNQIAPNIPKLMEFIDKAIVFVNDYLPEIVKGVQTIFKWGVAIVTTLGELGLFVLPKILDILTPIFDILSAVVGILPGIVKGFSALNKLKSGDFLGAWNDFRNFTDDMSERWKSMQESRETLNSTVNTFQEGLESRILKLQTEYAGFNGAVDALTQPMNMPSQYIRYDDGTPVEANVNIGTVNNYDTEQDVETLMDRIGRETLLQLRMQGVYA